MTEICFVPMGGNHCKVAMVMEKHFFLISGKSQCILYRGSKVLILLGSQFKLSRGILFLTLSLHLTKSFRCWQPKVKPCNIFESIDFRGFTVIGFIAITVHDVDNFSFDSVCFCLCFCFALVASFPCVFTLAVTTSKCVL